MRIVLTCDWFLKYAAAQAAALADAGAEVVLLCRHHASEFGGNRQERESTLERPRRAGVRVIEIPGRLSDARAVPALLTLRRRLARFAPDVVHAHDGSDPRALWLLAGYPTVLTVHDPSPHPGQPVPVARKRWFLHGSRDTWRARAQVIVVHSQRLAAELRLGASQRLAVIPHGLDIVTEPLPPPIRPTVAFFGRLAPYKGLDVLARAMPRVWEMRPDVHLAVAGAGDADIPLVDERVHVVRSYLPEDELESFFRAASLAVLPYTQASQTGAGSVAIGFGVPVVVTRVGGLPDLALDDSYVVDAGDPEDLAEAIVRHVDDNMATRGRVLDELAAPRSWRAVALSSLAVYEGLRTGGATPDRPPVHLTAER